MEIVIQKRKKLKLIVLVHKSHAQVFLEIQEEALGYQMNLKIKANVSNQEE